MNRNEINSKVLDMHRTLIDQFAVVWDEVDKGLAAWQAAVPVLVRMIDAFEQFGMAVDSPAGIRALAPLLRISIVDAEQEERAVRAVDECAAALSLSAHWYQYHDAHSPTAQARRVAFLRKPGTYNDILSVYFYLKEKA